MMNRIEDLQGASAIAIGGSSADVDLFRKYLDVELGKASPDSIGAQASGPQSITNTLKNFANEYIGAEQVYKNALNNMGVQSVGGASGAGQGISQTGMQRTGDYSITPDGIQLASSSRGSGQGYDSVINSLGSVGPGALGLPTGPQGAGWTGGYSSSLQPAAGTNEVPVDVESGGSASSFGNDTVAQTQQIMKAVTDDMWRTTRMNVGVQQAMGNFGRHQALGQMGGDIMRGLISGLTKGGG
jgi:hypothetical protein